MVRIEGHWGYHLSMLRSWCYVVLVFFFTNTIHCQRILFRPQNEGFGTRHEAVQRHHLVNRYPFLQQALPSLQSQQQVLLPQRLPFPTSSAEGSSTSSDNGRRGKILDMLIRGPYLSEDEAHLIHEVLNWLPRNGRGPGQSRPTHVSAPDEDILTNQIPNGPQISNQGHVPNFNSPQNYRPHTEENIPLSTLSDVNTFRQQHDNQVLKSHENQQDLENYSFGFNGGSNQIFRRPQESQVLIQDDGGLPFVNHAIGAAEEHLVPQGPPNHFLQAPFEPQSIRAPVDTTVFRPSQPDVPQFNPSSPIVESVPRLPSFVLNGNYGNLQRLPIFSSSYEGYMSELGQKSQQQTHLPVAQAQQQQLQTHLPVALPQQQSIVTSQYKPSSQQVHVPPPLPLSSAHQPPPTVSQSHEQSQSTSQESQEAPAPVPLSNNPHKFLGLDLDSIVSRILSGADSARLQPRVKSNLGVQSSRALSSNQVSSEVSNSIVQEVQHVPQNQQINHQPQFVPQTQYTQPQPQYQPPQPQPQYTPQQQPQVNNAHQQQNSQHYHSPPEVQFIPTGRSVSFGLSSNHLPSEATYASYTQTSVSPFIVSPSYDFDKDKPGSLASLHKGPSDRVTPSVHLQPIGSGGIISTTPSSFSGSTHAQSPYYQGDDTETLTALPSSTPSPISFDTSLYRLTSRQNEIDTGSNPVRNDLFVKEHYLQNHKPKLTIFNANIGQGSGEDSGATKAAASILQNAQSKLANNGTLDGNDLSGIAMQNIGNIPGLISQITGANVSVKFIDLDDISQLANLGIEAPTYLKDNSTSIPQNLFQTVQEKSSVKAEADKPGKTVTVKKIFLTDAFLKNPDLLSQLQESVAAGKPIQEVVDSLQAKMREKGLTEHDLTTDEEQILAEQHQRLKESASRSAATEAPLPVEMPSPVYEQPEQDSSAIPQSHQTDMTDSQHTYSNEADVTEPQLSYHNEPEVHLQDNEQPGPPYSHSTEYPARETPLYVDTVHDPNPYGQSHQEDENSVSDEHPVTLEEMHDPHYPMSDNYIPETNTDPSSHYGSDQDQSYESEQQSHQQHHQDSYEEYQQDHASEELNHTTEYLHDRNPESEKLQPDQDGSLSGGYEDPQVTADQTGDRSKDTETEQNYDYQHHEDSEDHNHYTHQNDQPVQDDDSTATDFPSYEEIEEEDEAVVAS